MLKRYFSSWGALALTVWILWLILVALVRTGHAETPYNYTRLRQELLAEISSLKHRIEILEQRVPGGVINVYTVDTAAGTITCRACQFTGEEKK